MGCLYSKPNILDISSVKYISPLNSLEKKANIKTSMEVFPYSFNIKNSTRIDNISLVSIEIYCKKSFEIGYCEALSRSPPLINAPPEGTAYLA